MYKDTSFSTSVEADAFRSSVTIKYHKPALAGRNSMIVA